MTMKITMEMQLFAVGIAVVGLAAFFFARPQKKSSPPRALGSDPQKYTPFKLSAVEKVSHDTRIFTFALQSAQHVLGLPIGKHVVIRANVNGEAVERKYTPISSDNDLGVFRLCIKVYFKDTHPRFPDGGVMSQHIESLKVGDSIDVRGPTGLITYRGKGAFSINGKPVQVKHLGLVAGGTGITPCLQVIEHVLRDTDDKTTLSLIFGNQTEADILLKDRLDTLARDNAQLRVFYTLDKAPEGWTQGEGFIDKDMCGQHLPPPGDDTIILMCGPPPMIKYACTPNLLELGHSNKRQFQF